MAVEIREDDSGNPIYVSVDNKGNATGSASKEQVRKSMQTNGGKLAEGYVNPNSKKQKDPKDPTDPNLQYGSPYYGYGGGGGGGSVQSTGPTDDQKQAAGFLKGIAKANQGTIKDAGKNWDDIYGKADAFNNSMKNLQLANAMTQDSADWFRQQLKLNKAVESTLNSAGNAAYGSWLLDYADAVQLEDDLIDSKTLDTERKNANAIYDNYYTAMQQNAQARNEKAAETEQKLRNAYSDYAAQLNNIHPDLAKKVFKTTTGSKKDDKTLKSLQKKSDKDDLSKKEKKKLEALEKKQSSTLKKTSGLDMGTDYFSKHMAKTVTPTQQALYRTGTKEDNTNHSSWLSSLHKGYSGRS